MAKSKRYIVKYYGRSVEMSKANSSVLVYRIPYQNIKTKDDSFFIDNSFIVYVLYGRNESGKDVVYVGKSKNGIKNRPTSHEDKYDKWEYCYILTQFKERTFFNDGTIQYIEDTLSNRINSLGSYVNTTINTSSNTANMFDMEDCDEYLEEVYQMLDVLGLDLITHHVLDEEIPVEDNELSDIFVVPDGIYYLKRKIKRENRVYKASMQVSNGKYIVLKGSMVCLSDTAGLIDSVVNKRHEADIIDGVLKEDVVFNSPSLAASFIVGGAVNGWQYWKDQNNEMIDKFRK